MKPAPNTDPNTYPKRTSNNATHSNYKAKTKQLIKQTQHAYKTQWNNLKKRLRICFKYEFAKATAWINMAYLRKEKETVEMDYPLAKVWQAIQKAITSLDWVIEENDDAKHNVKAKTKGAIMGYNSAISVNAVAVAEGTTRVSVSAETPVTTLTSIADFGRTKERVNSFLAALSQKLTPENNNSEEPE